jgi:hypothetical protein
MKLFVFKRLCISCWGWMIRQEPTHFVLSTFSTSSASACLRRTIAEPIDFNLWELRAIRGNMICRLFYFYDKATISVITSRYTQEHQKAIMQTIQRTLVLKAAHLRGD